MEIQIDATNLSSSASLKEPPEFDAIAVFDPPEREEVVGVRVTLIYLRIRCGIMKKSILDWHI